MLTYIIQSGDTFWGLSQRFGCTLQSILVANPGVVPELLQIGQLVNIPVTNPDNDSTVTHSLLPTFRPPNNARLETTLNPRAPSPIKQLRQFIDPASQTTNVPADLIGAVIYQESGGNINVNATLNPGNIGLDSGVMQVNQYTANELQTKYPFRFNGLHGIAKDVMLGASYLKDMYESIGDKDWAITLRAYNSGPNGVDKTNLRARPAHTGDSTYVDKVLHFWVDISQGNSLPADHYESIYGRGF